MDEIPVAIFPFVLGRGKKLFDGGALPCALKLLHSKVSTGVTINRYVLDGEVATGSFALAQPTEAKLERRWNPG